MKKVFPGIGAREKYQIRGQREIAHRALAVRALLYRQDLERGRFDGYRSGRAMALVQREDINRWIKDSGISAHLTPLERKLLTAVLGGWTATNVFNPGFEESLGTLLWALSIVQEMPRADQVFPDRIHLLTDTIGSPSDFLRTINLRSEDELLEVYHQLGASIVEARHLLEGLKAGPARLSLSEKRKVSDLQMVIFNSRIRRSALAWVLGIQGEWNME